MVENEFIFLWSILFKKAKYIIMIRHQGQEDVDQLGEVNEIKEIVKNINKKQTSIIKHNQKKIENNLMTKVYEKHLELEDRLNAKFAEVDRRLDEHIENLNKLK